MQTLSNFPGLGEVTSGSQTCNNVKTLYNDNFTGGYRIFDDTDIQSPSRIGAYRLASGAWIGAVLLRNVSGGDLDIAGKLAQLDLSGDLDTGVFTQVTGIAADLQNEACVLGDPWLDVVVPDDDLFWGIVRGPAPGITPALQGGFAAALAVGQPIACAAIDGCVTGVVTPGVNDLGRSCVALADTDVSTAALVLWNNPFFGQA